MKPSVLYEIIRFREARGSGPAGKFIQRLLALALVRGGYDVEEEHTVEGPDLLVTDFQIEVKTATTEPFPIGQKDVKDINTAMGRGKKPALAFLECSSHRGWTVADAKGLREGNYRRQDLAMRRIPELENLANDNFDAVVEAWVPLLSNSADVAFNLMDERRREGRWEP